MKVVIPLACVFVGGVFLLAGGRSALEEWEYRRHGARTEGIAIGKSVRFATDTSDTAYEVSYEIAVDGRSVERTETVPVHLWERVEPGSRMPIEHVRGRPRTLRIVADGSQLPSALMFCAIGAGLIFLALVVVVSGARPWMLSCRWIARRRSAGSWPGAILLTIGIVLLAVAVPNARDEWRFSEDAVSTEGIVLTKERKRSKRQLRASEYEATYRVVIANGTFEGRARLPYDRWVQLVERQPATVRFLPYAPATNRLDGPRPWRPAFNGALGLLLAALGARGVRHSLGGEP